MLTSEVRIEVSCFSALKKRATIPPKPQLVSRERTAKGKASRFFGVAVVSLCGRFILKEGTYSFFPGTVSSGRVCHAKAGMDRIHSNRRPIPGFIIIYSGVFLSCANAMRCKDE